MIRFSDNYIPDVSFLLLNIIICPIVLAFLLLHQQIYMGHVRFFGLIFTEVNDIFFIGHLQNLTFLL